MDHNNIFHSKFSGDSSSSSSFDPMFSGVSLQTLLTFNPSLFNDGFHSLTDDPPLPDLPESITVDNNTPKLLIPKTEHNHHPINFLPSIQQPEELLHLPQQPFNFFPTYHHQSFDNFHRLPQLRSPELSFTNRKRLHHHLTTETTPPSQPPPPPPHSGRGKAVSVIPQSHLARQRRQKLSEKTRCLQKLMPWDKKMDQATLLEEAYKYVKFLQAQVSVLQLMPSNTNSHFHNGGKGGVFGDMERLNRNQVLQVLVNSSVAQTMFYSRGLCVFSVEQLSLLRKFSERKQQLQNQQQQQQQMSDYGSSKTFFD